MILPNLVAFQATDKSRDKYLGNINHADPKIKRFLAFTANEALSPLARFKIEFVGDGLVQIRSRFTNKLWSRSLCNENWIVTSSSEEVEDKSKWECTLFKPNIQGRTITFTHVQLENNLILKEINTGFGARQCLCVDSGLSSIDPVKATIIDLTYLLQLPKYITFKAHNKFLGPSSMDHECYEPGYGWNSGHYEFITYSMDDPTKIESLIEVLQNHDGSVCFKFVKTGRLWCVNNVVKSWVTVEKENNRQLSEDPAKYRFNPVSTDDGTTIALQSVYNSKYCAPVQLGVHLESLAAISSNTQNIEKFQVVEPLSKRTVEVTRLRTEDSIIISDSYITMDSKEVDHDQNVEFVCKELETGVWSKSVPMVTDLTFSIESPIPGFDASSNTYSASEKISSDDHFKWGAKHGASTPVIKTVAIKVPCGSMTSAKLRARCVVFEIPFDYTQIDTITRTGQTKSYTTNLQDGLYTGELHFDFKIETENRKL